MYFARDENLKSKQKQLHICDKVLIPLICDLCKIQDQQTDLSTKNQWSNFGLM